MPFQYDIAVIGSGPGGYSTAQAAGWAGAKACIIEKDELGGVCVNRGCIPTKTLLSTASLYLKLKNAGQYGITAASSVSIDYTKILDRVMSVVSNIKQGMESVLAAQKIEIIKGEAKLVSENIINVKVRAKGSTLARGMEPRASTAELVPPGMPGALAAVNDREISAKNIIIAAGSKPQELSNFKFDGKTIISSEEFLKCTNLPETVLIVGAGVIGCEWAGILRSLGVSVTLVEALNKILPGEDSDLTRIVEANLKKMGVEIKLGIKVDHISEEKAIVCIGRQPAMKGLTNILETSDKGWIKVNEYMQTSVPNIYAVGDIAGRSLLAYTAQREGVVAVNNIFGRKMAMDYKLVPRVVFSMPELASVGLREHEAEGAGIVRGYFKGLGKALADGEYEGFAKIIYDKTNYKLLGVGIAGKNASELINEPALALQCGLTVKEWRERIWPHPVLSEIFGMALEKIK